MSTSKTKGKYHEFFHRIKNSKLISPTEFARHIEQHMSECKLWSISTSLRDLFIKIIVLILKNEPWQELEQKFLQEITLPLQLDEMLQLSNVKKGQYTKSDSKVHHIVYRKCQRASLKYLKRESRHNLEQEFLQDVIHVTGLVGARFTARHQALVLKHLETLTLEQLGCLFWRIDELGILFFANCE